ncbi:hypothetical protein [Sphingomonas immobilis]|uniref:Uncharacterized protein n=1 Tax=Sphingomonas immobilis TaxID=3063997 RepID=A0ABT8ZVE5_9SPHN|nr:hypothetical protein [Sphingomonas sp. CA1-15]MDO7841114.1 hypothetical protein [Sphingomonas sp. CA1-15]
MDFARLSALPLSAQAGSSRQCAPGQGHRMKGAAARADIVFAAPPLTFNRRAALTYTGIADKLFAQLEDNGALTGRPIGRNGERVYLREQLDEVTIKLFRTTATDIDDEFEGIGRG